MLRTQRPMNLEELPREHPESPDPLNYRPPDVLAPGVREHMQEVYSVNKIHSQGEATFPWAHATVTAAKCGPYEIRQTTITRVVPLKGNTPARCSTPELEKEAEAFLLMDTTARGSEEWRRGLEQVAATRADSSVLATAGRLGTMMMDTNANANNARQRLDPEVELALSQEQGKTPLSATIAVDLTESESPALSGVIAARATPPLTASAVHTPVNSPLRPGGILTPSRMTAVQFQPPTLSAQSSPARSEVMSKAASSADSSSQSSDTEEESDRSLDGLEQASNTDYRRRPVTPAPQEDGESTEVSEADDRLLDAEEKVELEIQVQNDDLE